ncbi:hypothetical protein CIB84_010050, partial [Bambusicola thoracicus]
PAGESAEENPASEPEGDAGDVTGGGDPGSALSSGTENPADRMGPEGGKDESERGKYSQGSSRLLKELLKEMKKAARVFHFHSAIQEAKGLQSHLEDLELELKAVKEVHGNSPECCFLSEDGPESESGEPAAELVSFTLHSLGQASAIFQRFLARHSYSPAEGPKEDPESELPLTAGHHLNVFGDVDENGRFQGELTDGTRGLVPSNLVAEVSDEDLDTTMPPELC